MQHNYEMLSIIILNVIKIEIKFAMKTILLMSDNWSFDDKWVWAIILSALVK